MKQTSGNMAELAVADYLVLNGYKIISRNWRTRFCEIDIVAEKSKSVFFIEVKYRASDHQGDGLDYITSRKLQQMSFAAESWVSENKWSGQYQLLVASVTGDDYAQINLVEVD